MNLFSILHVDLWMSALRSLQTQINEKKVYCTAFGTALYANFNTSWFRSSKDGCLCNHKQSHSTLYNMFFLYSSMIWVPTANFAYYYQSYQKRPNVCCKMFLRAQELDQICFLINVFSFLASTCWPKPFAVSGNLHRMKFCGTAVAE